MLRDYLLFLGRACKLSFTGGGPFFAWMIFLTVLCGIGGNAYMHQFVNGLTTTGMTDQVSWGAYIANFTFLVGVAAAAVMLVIPAYVYRNKEMHDVVLLGELLAIAAIMMCLIFVMVDLGRPDRFWHLIPVLGKFNFPISMLAWDVIVLNGYLVLNLHICGYLLYCKYRGRKPTWLFYIPFVFVAIFWAVSIHTVTAFLYVGLVGRPFWNAAIIAPRFLCSAFVAGPAILILAFQIIRRISNYKIPDKGLHLLRNIVTTALLINLFLFACEVFKEYYSGALHGASMTYLLQGLEHHGHRYDALVPWIWSALILEVIAVGILITPLGKKLGYLDVACLCCIVGVWVEKGMGLIIPGFIPTPLGNIVEYLPTTNELLVCMGAWAFGILMYSWMLRLALPILTGEFSHDKGIALSMPVAHQGEMK